jgi:hypothetical protein
MPLQRDPAFEAAYRLTEAVAVFLREDEQTEFFARALKIVNRAIEAARLETEPSRN